MKTFKTTLIAICLICVSSPILFSQTTPGSVEYMESFSASNEAIKNDTWAYLKAVTRGKGARKVDAKRQKLIKEIREAKSAAIAVGSFNGDATYKDVMKGYYDMSVTVLKEDFDKILDMEEISEQSYDAMEAYLLAKEKANEKLQDAFKKLVDGQKAFADANGIELLEAENDKKDDKIEQASRVLTYYNEVYLIFFKVYKQEMYVLDALARNDISAFEQNNSTLGDEAMAAIEKLGEVGNFEGDPSLKAAAKNISGFYLRESKEDFAIISDFYLKKDQFEKVKANFDAIKAKNRTNEDIETMNNAGKEYNESVQKYNKVNEVLNKERSAFLNQWNKKVDAFFGKFSS